MLITLSTKAAGLRSAIHKAGMSISEPEKADAALLARDADDPEWLDRVISAKVPILYSPPSTPPPGHPAIPLLIGITEEQASSVARALRAIQLPFFPEKQTTPAPVKERKAPTRSVKSEQIDRCMSICVTLCNRASYVETLIKNILQQDFDAKRLELCITDGNSTDDLKEVLAKYSERFAQIKYAISDRGKLPFQIVSNCLACDTNAQVCSVASFEKVLRLDPEIRFGNPQTLQYVFNALDEPEMVIALPYTMLAEGVPWSDTALPERGARGAVVRGEGNCIAFNKSNYIETGGMDERFAAGFAGEDSYFHAWHKRNGVWDLADDIYMLFHEYHNSSCTPANMELREVITLPLLRKLMEVNAKPNSHLQGEQVDAWRRPEMITDMQIITSKQSALFAVVVSYKDTPDMSLPLERTLRSLRAQTLRANMEIIAVVAGKVNSSAKTALAALTDRIVHVDTDEAFCKSKLINAGVIDTSAPYIVIHDADILVPPEYMEYVAAAFAAGYESVQVGGRLHKISKDFAKESEEWDFRAFQKSKRLDSMPSDIPGKDGRSYAVTRELFLRIGGMYEGYKGWGYEDVSFLGKVAHLSTHFKKACCDVIHLYHTPTPLPVNSANKQLYKTETSAKEVIERDKKAFAQVYGARIADNSTLHGKE